jgi:hypothetical protein
MTTDQQVLVIIHFGIGVREKRRGVGKVELGRRMVSEQGI